MNRLVEPTHSGVPNRVVDRTERRPVSLSGHALLEDGTTAKIQVLDLSYDGCGIETPATLMSGESIKISVLRRGVIDAEVRWCADGKAGLVFKSQQAPAKPYWPRRKPRVALSAEVSIRRLGRGKYRVRVFDASPDGCKVELGELPRAQEHVFIKFDGLEQLEAEVCWVEDHCAGLRFEKPIHPAVFDLMIEKLRA